MTQNTQHTFSKTGPVRASKLLFKKFKTLSSNSGKYVKWAFMGAIGLSATSVVMGMLGSTHAVKLFIGQHPLLSGFVFSAAALKGYLTFKKSQEEGIGRARTILNVIKSAGITTIALTPTALMLGVLFFHPYTFGAKVMHNTLLDFITQFGSVINKHTLLSEPVQLWKHAITGAFTSHPIITSSILIGGGAYMLSPLHMVPFVKKNGGVNIGSSIKRAAIVNALGVPLLATLASMPIGAAGTGALIFYCLGAGAVGHVVETATMNRGDYYAEG